LAAGGIPAPILASARLAREQRDSFSAPIAPGSPFGVTLVDVAARAGLNSRCVFGGEYVKRWIVETTGCGIAFFDYDDDGWGRARTAAESGRASAWWRAATRRSTRSEAAAAN